jgi:hypothetical protein
MDVEPLRTVLDELADLDVCVADRVGLERAAELVTRVYAAAGAFDVAIARRASQLDAVSGAATDVVAARGRRTRKDARAAAERSAVCDRMAGFEDALASGAITTGHLDAVANATKHLDDAAKAAVAGYTDDLLGAAATSTVAEFERDVRNLTRLLTTTAAADDGEGELARQRSNRRLSRWIDQTTGMWKLFAELDPETGATIWTALDHHLATITRRDTNAEVPFERLAADALVELVTTPPSGERNVPEVYVHIDAATLTAGRRHDHSLCELTNGTPLPVSTVQRLCCDAVIVAIIEHDGHPIDVARERRTATRKQRRLLRAMYRTCAHPHCTVTFDHCQIHHVTWWERLGRTDIDNLVPLCTSHHHLVHEGHWTLTLTPDRTITLTRPDGTTHHTSNTTDRRAGSAVRSSEAAPAHTSSADRTNSLATATVPDRGRLDHLRRERPSHRTRGSCQP